MWSPVLRQALNNACAPIRIMRSGRPTFRSAEVAKARSWLLRPSPDSSMVCHLADIEHGEVQAYARSAIGVGVIV